ncbi:VanW family protein [Virgibacillus proomii]|uniref:VanW family protein n=1 Tax=Virgibacillus proomii TaxID=84407 RepID=UPI001C10286C|nr:VanW family protein [Virgibacillus proomii]MBU5266461.1 VanW family protein [Virgibacillus proomii]
MKRVIIIASLLFCLVIPEFVNAESEHPSDVFIKKVEVNQYNLNEVDQLFIDQRRLQTLIQQLKQKIYQPPVNARINQKGKIIPEQLGTTVDTDAFHILFHKTFYDATAKGFNVPTMPVYPRVDKTLLEEISKKQLGSYVTHYKEKNQERTRNIELSAKAIDNHVVFPGELFSFNKVVGERTIDKGYKRAPVIVKGELSEDVGGGICQVSSTLFNAVNLEGIEIVERYTHSKQVPYVPPGKDATVSWWGPDFSFKNRYNQPLLIRADANNGKMRVRIFSSDIAENFGGQK